MCYSYVVYGRVPLISSAPAGPPVNVRVENASSYSVLVEWLPPEVPNGIITHYFIYINYTNGTHHKRQVGAEYSLYLLEELRPHQVVGIRVSASTIAGEGPLCHHRSQQCWFEHSSAFCGTGDSNSSCCAHSKRSYDKNFGK